MTDTFTTRDYHEGPISSDQEQWYVCPCHPLRIANFDPKPTKAHYPGMQAFRTDARFSTYSGAPSLQPSLAPTLETHATSTRSSNMPQQRSHQHQHSSNEKGTNSTSALYTNSNQSSSTISTTGGDPAKSADLRHWSSTLGRMQDARLESQRYVMTDKKSDEVSQLALGAKVERALARRMTGQDATFRAKKALDVEKRSLEVEAN